MVACLGDEGYRVVPADTVTAVAFLAADRFGLIVADAGRAFSVRSEARWVPLDRLRTLAGEATPVLIMTAHRPDNLANHAAHGFTELLPKPFDLDELLVKVARLYPPPAPGPARAG